ncbi:hypothetical protein U0026_19810 [Kluyvera intermedia]|uniref:hypothetical protein n=1 Tax=Kluyvera intermedia TaxID=61648 RepID=UPI000B1256BF|nr:hypothetical protein [Kluyvera intermedia]WQD29219.1 hypothetical protein U0026_19810 [Kluyvera intermedia]VDZ85003.1 Uncharacterised protein [Kluyvera intermedia]
MDQNIPKEQESTAQSSIRRVSIRNLFLDPNNYRLIHEDDQVDVPENEIKDKIV